MKHLVWLLCLLLLSGCGARTAAPSPTSSPPIPTAVVPAPPSTPTPGTDTWGEDIPADKLPLELGGLYEDGPVSLVVTASIPEEGIALYTVRKEGQSMGKRLLRHGNFLQVVGTSGLTSDTITYPVFQWADFDGDGATELATVEEVYTTTTLTLYEWDGYHWTSHPYTTYEEDLHGVLNFTQSGRSASLTYGGQSATYTMGPGGKQMGEELTFGGAQKIAIFSVDAKNTITAVFGVGAKVDGEAMLFATVSAEVEYEDQSFTLRHISLISIGGV